MNYSVIIVAAGKGSRMNLGYNKAYYRFNDKTILEMTMSVFLNDVDCKQVIVVTDPDLYKQEIQLNQDRIVVTAGGSSRQESVNCGLKLVTQEYVMIHDGARPYLDVDTLTRIKEVLVEKRAVCVGVPVKDTIKVVEGEDIISTPRRDTLYAAQTPQAFETSLIKMCMDQANREHFEGTDDSSLVEKYGNVSVKIVLGSYGNYKITTIEDIQKTTN